MTNHVHLLIRTGMVPLATIMRQPLTEYAVSFSVDQQQIRPNRWGGRKRLSAIVFNAVRKSRKMKV